VVPQDSQICSGNIPERQKSATELCQILCIVNIEIAIYYTHGAQHCALHRAGIALPWR